MEINWTSIISSTIAAVINAIAVFLAMRYTAKILDRIEKSRDKDCKKGKDGDTKSK